VHLKLPEDCQFNLAHAAETKTKKT